MRDGATSTFFRDADGDGYGDPAVSVQASIAPPGHVATGTDCDDTRPAVHPGAAEVDNGIDDNCDGQVDDGPPPVFQLYSDLDGDGFGDLDTGYVGPTPPPNFVGVGGDCDDGNPAVHPGATEVANGIDDDCDGTTDEETPAPPSLESLTPPHQTVSDGGSVTLYVRLAAPASSDTTVTVTSSSNLVASVPGSVVVPTGQDEGTAAVAAHSPGLATITATLNGDSRTAEVEVVP